MSSENQKKKTIHFNMGLGTNKVIMRFFEEANDGRSFSSFTKDILYAQASAYFNEPDTAYSQPVIQQQVKGAIGEARKNEQESNSPASPSGLMEEIDQEEELKQPAKTDIASAAASMFGANPNQ